jgi:hypothetical protein
MISRWPPERLHLRNELKQITGLDAPPQPPAEKLHKAVHHRSRGTGVNTELIL